MTLGLTQNDLDYIISCISTFKDISEAIVFGSRAKGNYKYSSDIDIAIKGSNIKDETIASLSAKLNEEGPLPYFSDVLDYHSISNENLISHIDRVGIPIYKSTYK